MKPKLISVRRMIYTPSFGFKKLHDFSPFFNLQTFASLFRYEHTRWKGKLRFCNKRVGIWPQHAQLERPQCIHLGWEEVSSKWNLRKELLQHLPSREEAIRGGVRQEDRIGEEGCSSIIHYEKKFTKLL